MGKWIDVLRYGSEVANVEAWKKGGVNVLHLTGLLSALLGIAYQFGWLKVELPPDLVASVAAMLVSLGSVAGMVFTVVTSKRAGILPAREEPAVDIPAHGYPELTGRDEFRPDLEIARRNSSVEFGKPLPSVDWSSPEPRSAGKRTDPFNDNTGA